MAFKLPDVAGPMTMARLDGYRERSAKAKEKVDGFVSDLTEVRFLGMQEMLLAPKEYEALFAKKEIAQREAEQAVLIWIAQDCREV